MSYFADNILSLCQEVLATADTVHELEAPRLSLDTFLDHFNRLSQEETDRVQAALKPTTCPVDPCMLWLVKVEVIVYVSLTSEPFPGVLKL